MRVHPAITGSTYAVQPIRARLWRTSWGVRTLFDQSGHDIVMRVRPLNMCAPPPAPSRPLKNTGRSAPILLLTFLFQRSNQRYFTKGNIIKVNAIQFESPAACTSSENQEASSKCNSSKDHVAHRTQARRELLLEQAASTLQSIDKDSDTDTDNENEGNAPHIMLPLERYMH